MTAPLRRLRAHSVSNDLLEAATTDAAIYRNAAVHPAASTSTLELAIPGPSQISRASCSESDLSSASSSLSKLSLLDNDDDSGEDDCDDFESDVRGLLATPLFLPRDLLLVLVVDRERRIVSKRRGRSGLRAAGGLLFVGRDSRL